MEINDELNEIYEYLLLGYQDDPNLIKERLNRLAIFQTRLGFFHKTNLHTLRLHRFEEIKNMLSEIIQEKLSAKVQNTIVECIATDIQQQCDFSERLLSSIDKQIRIGMTLLSYCKSEMQNSNLH